MKKQIVTITGELGSGKSVVAKQLAERLKFARYSTGDMQRRFANSRGMTILQMNRYAERHKEVDHEIDNYTVEMGKNEDRFVLDSRMAWHFIPHSLRIYLFVAPDVAAMRIRKDTSRASESYESQKQAQQSIAKRRDSECRRFQKLYGVDLFQLNNYQLVLDTSSSTVQQVCRFVLEQFVLWKNGEFRQDCLKLWIPKAIKNDLNAIQYDKLHTSHLLAAFAKHSSANASVADTASDKVEMLLSR